MAGLLQLMPNIGVVTTFAVKREGGTFLRHQVITTTVKVFGGFRHWFARLKRRGKVVSRSMDDLIHATAIYFHRVNLRYGYLVKSLLSFSCCGDEFHLYLYSILFRLRLNHHTLLF